MSHIVDMDPLYIQSGTTNTLVATWSHKDCWTHVDHYMTQWRYKTEDGDWLLGQDNDSVTLQNDTYTAPDNASNVRCRVKPVSKTHEVTTTNSSGKKTTTTQSYWTGSWCDWVKYNLTKHAPPDTPSAPTVTVSDYTLTARLETTDEKALAILFELYVDDGTNYTVRSGWITVTTGVAEWSHSMEAGHKYKVRCAARNKTSEDMSDWSDYSDNVETVAKEVSTVSCEAASSTSVKVTFGTVTNATSYNIEYAVKQEYFDSSNEVSSMSVTASPAYVTGLDTGQTWYFRVQAVNDQGNSAWSSVVSTMIGSAPSAPTTWSSTTTAMVGDTVTLYWVHNSEDGSKSRGAQIEITKNGSTSYVTVDNSDYDSEDEETTYSYSLSLSGYTGGDTVLWRVRTKGVTGEYGSYSVQRQINVYAPATLALSCSSSLTTFPYSIVATAGPSTQTPVCYTLVVTANEAHETTNEFGGTVYVNAGQTVFSKTYYTSTTPYTMQLTVDNCSLAHAQTYTGTVTVAMDTGLTAEETFSFTTNWSDIDYNVECGLEIDTDALSAIVNPYCEDDDGNLVSGVTLSVYRREFDGTFTTIGTGISNTRYSNVTDPHPALDYARYRVVAVETSTGAMCFEDIPGHPILDPHIVIQWDEEWYDFDFDYDSDESHVSSWSGSMLKLLYNIDTIEEKSQDVSLVEYIGREHPVSYYGTQKGETASWSCVIDKEDKESLYQLRRLSSYQGDVYVRNPSGVGYWAQVSVSLSDTHAELIIPVTLQITRVEGGA